MFKKLSLLSLFTLLPASFYYAQTTAYAYVKDIEGKPVENAEVDMLQSTKDVTADKIGYFQFVDLVPGHYTLIISKPGLETKTIDFDVTADQKRKDLGVVTMNYSGTTGNAGVVVIDDSTADNDEGGSSSMQPTVGLLSSGRDAFANVSAFELGAYWFRPRGVENRYEDVMFNGIPMSKNDDGKIDFSNWGGLNDVTRYPYEYVDNITPSEYTFGNLGGVVYYNTRASSYRKGVSLAYSYTNRSYYNRAMATYSTGLMKNGWAITVSGSRRWADSGVIEGTYQDSWAYFAAIEKQFSKKFALNLTAFGAPTYRAGNSPNTQETYDLMGKDYNAYWGWQDNEKRNSRIRKVFEPIFMLSSYWKINKNTNWNNTLSYQFGSDARSRLDWFHGQDPSPTYYRKLPSYMFADDYNALIGLDPSSQAYADQMNVINGKIDNWKSTTNMQIDWNSLYMANYLNRTDMYGNPHGAVYTLVDDVNKDKTVNFASHFDTKLQSNWKLNVNFNYQNFRSDNFRRIKDLLGANYANNLDPFANDQPNNMDNPNVQVGVGDRTQYSYILKKDAYNLNASTEIDLNRWNIVASVFTAYTEAQRDGDFRFHAYADSKGLSRKFYGFDAGLKGKVTYKINGKNFIVYNGAFFSLSPTLNEIFISPRVTGMISPYLQNQMINSNDLSYILRGQIIKLRFTGYYTTINNATEISRFYVDISNGTGGGGNALVAEVASGINKTYKGLELGAEIKATPTLSITAVGSYGDYTITNNPRVSTFDNDYGYRDDWGRANVKGYKIAGTPQKAFSLGIRYNSPKYWWIGASGNFLMDQYLDFSLLNKTPKMYTDPTTGKNYTAGTDSFSGIAYPEATSEVISRLTAEKKFPNQFMLNANIGKSFLFGKYRMGISLAVNNILNNRNYVTGGFEQARAANYPEAYAESQRAVSFFGPKLWYDRGRTFFANIYFRF